MFGKKKEKIEQNVTPQDVSKHIDKSIAQDRTIERFHVKADSAEIVAYKRRKKILSIILSVGIFILLILFIISMLLTQWGDLIISLDRPAINKGIVLSETSDFKTKHVELAATQVTDVTNITYNWLPTDLDTAKDGSHNGENYVAYTFYCRNEGEVEVDYKATLDVTGVAKSADEAVRVMVFKNGKQAIYGKGKYDNRKEAETDCTRFVEDDVVMTTTTEAFKPEQVDKYTIVIWIEGNDPECIDDIRGGHTRMRMLFEVLEDEED